MLTRFVLSRQFIQTFPFKEVYNHFSAWIQQKSCIIIFLYMSPPKTGKPWPALLTVWELLLRPDEVPCIYTFCWSIFLFTGYIMYFVLFFLLWWQLCVPKPASFWCVQRKVALWRKWSFFMSLVMFLYSCTFILPHCLFSSLSTGHIPLEGQLLGFLSLSNTHGLYRLSNYSAYSDNFLQCTLIKLF